MPVKISWCLHYMAVSVHFAILKCNMSIVLHQPDGNCFLLELIKDYAESAASNAPISWSSCCMHYDTRTFWVAGYEMRIELGFNWVLRHRLKLCQTAHYYLLAAISHCLPILSLERLSFALERMSFAPERLSFALERLPTGGSILNPLSAWYETHRYDDHND